MYSFLWNNECRATKDNKYLAFERVGIFALDFYGKVFYGNIDGQLISVSLLIKDNYYYEMLFTIVFRKRGSYWMPTFQLFFEYIFLDQKHDNWLDKGFIVAYFTKQAWIFRPVQALAFESILSSLTIFIACLIAKKDHLLPLSYPPTVLDQNITAINNIACTLSKQWIHFLRCDFFRQHRTL